MLTCIFHPIDAMRVVEHEEAERLQESGVWFDCPSKAQKYREKVEQEINQESEGKNPKIEKRGKKHERQ